MSVVLTSQRLKDLFFYNAIILTFLTFFFLPYEDFTSVCLMKSVVKN